MKIKINESEIERLLFVIIKVKVIVMPKGVKNVRF